MKYKTAESVLNAYYDERLRRENVRAEDMVALMDRPKERSPDSGAWDQLLGLTRGCNPLALLRMYEAHYMYSLAKWQCQEDGCNQVVAHDHKPVLDDDGKDTGATEPVTRPITDKQAAGYFRIGLANWRHDVRGVKSTVAENLGRLREADARMRANPTFAELRAYVARVTRGHA